MAGTPPNPSNCVAYGKFDTDVIDDTGNNTFVNNGTSSATGIISNGRFFDGINDTIDLGFSPSVGNLQDTFSISLWIKPSSVTEAAQVVFSNDDVGNGNRGFILYTDTNGWGTSNSIFALIHDGSNYYVVSAGNNAISAGNWYHVVYTWNRSSQSAKLYLNGVDVTFFEGSSGTVGTISNNNYWLGFYNGLQAYYNGIIDEVAVFDTTLSADNVTFLYNSGSGIQYPFSILTGVLWNGITISKLNGIAISRIS